MERTLVRLNDGSEHEAIIRKQWFYSTSGFEMPEEHMYDIALEESFLRIFRNSGSDIFTFIKRNFLDKHSSHSGPWYSELEPIALLKLRSYEVWSKSISHNARWQAKKGKKTGLYVKKVEVDETFLRNAFKIYNETPIRQGRKYTGYGLTMEKLRKKFCRNERTELHGVFFNNEMIGLMWIAFGDRVAAIRSFVSLLAQRNKYPNDVLIDAVVQRCLEKGYNYLTYWNIGYNPGLDFFKRSHGFKAFNVPRYYVPLSSKGELAIKLKLHKPLEHSFPSWLVRASLPTYNSINRFIPAPVLKYIR